MFSWCVLESPGGLQCHLLSYCDGNIWTLIWTKPVASDLIAAEAAAL